MRLPVSTLKSFISIELEIEKIEETLTLLGIEIDAVHSRKPHFQGVVAAEVKKTERHPNAENLQVAQVFDGIHTYQIVCSAANCRAGIRVPLAKIGASLSDEEGNIRKIEKNSIRGIESHGMLCSAQELGLCDSSDGLLELPSDTPLGENCLFLWDPVLEISLTPNLGHCMSALGIARELSAAWQKPLHDAKLHLKENHSLPIPIEVSVQESGLCPRYTARFIQNVKVGPSPFWLQQQLRAAGHRPINNVVDATNYMLLKYGQPMHAFDAQKIDGKTIEIAPTEKVQTFHGLDGNQWEVPVGTLAISDSKKIIALAGILGGMNSAVSESTKSILLEAAAFDPLTIRRASKKMGLRTDSSFRFEKGVDLSAISHYLNEAAQLIAEISGGEIAKGMVDIQAKPSAPRRIRCRSERVNQILGTSLSVGEIDSIFHRLGFKTKGEEVEVPSYRNDLHEEIDLIEEVARIYGYNNIQRPLPRATSPQIPHDPAYLFETELRRRLAGLGLQEFLTCDLISPRLAEISQELSHYKSTLLHTLHSKSEEYSILRPSLLPGLLQVVRHNLDQKNLSFSAFEIGRIHFMQDQHPTELPMAAILLTGKHAPHHWDKKPLDADFFDLKGLIENLLQGLRIPSIQFTPSSHMTFHPGRQADVYINSLCIGSFGELHPQLLLKMDIKQKVYYAELNAQAIQSHQGPAPHMIPLPQFPSSERDLTLPLLSNAHVAPILEKIRTLAPPLLERFELIDLFRSADKSNVTIRFIYRDRSKTISFEEVEAAHAKLTSQL